MLNRITGTRRRHLGNLRVEEDTHRKDGRQFVQELTSLYEHDKLLGRGDDSTNRLIGFVDSFTISDENQLDSF